MNELKQTILKQLLNEVDKLFTGIDGAQKELSMVNNDIIRSGQELVQVNTEVANLRKEKNDILKQVRQEQTELQKEKESILMLKNESAQSIFRANAALKTILNETETARQAKAELDNEIRSIEPMKKVTISLEKTINNLTGDVKMVESEIKTLTSQRDGLDKEIKEKNKELVSLDKQITEKNKEILPTLESLSDREKKVKEREAGIMIIEQRYKKLYGDKGAGFKI